MAFDPITAAIAAAPSIGQLLIGENSLFSGKKRLASRELKKNFETGQNMGIGSKYYDYLSAMRGQAQQGIGEASKSLYNQQIGRSQASALRALSGRRSALGGIGSIVAAGAESGLNLAAMDEQIRRQGQMAANEALFNIAGLEQQNELRKREEAANYWGSQRQESDASISSAIQGIGQAIGAGVQSGQFNQQLGVLGGTGSGGARSWGNVLGNIGKMGANTLAQSTASSIGQSMGSAIMPPRPNTSRLMGNSGNWASGLGTSRSIMPKSYGGQ
jgi:hypothetical protein